MSASASAQGITATFASHLLGKVTNIALTVGVTDLDETDFSHTRENHQAGIATVSGSIDCLGDQDGDVDEGDIGNLALGGTVTKDYGTCICTNIDVGASVKGQRTVRYSFMSSCAT